MTEMKRFAWILVSALVLMMLSSTAVQAQSSSIAYSSDRYGTDMDIYNMKENGGAQTQLTSESEAAGRPSISLSGQKIVYDDHDDILMINSNGTGFQNLTITQPTLCGDHAAGKGCEDADAGRRVNAFGDFRIVFTRETNSGPSGTPPFRRVANIYTASVDVSAGGLFDIVQLTNSTECADPIEYQPAWCGTNNIVWSREIGSLCGAESTYYWQICTMNEDGSHLVCHFAGTNTANQYASCNSDGTTIAFARSDGANVERPHDICTMDFDGSNLDCDSFVNPADPNNDYDDTRPVWSPSDSVIAFASDRLPEGPDYEIWVRNADGTGSPQVRTDNTDPDDDPDYGPALLP